MSKAHLFVTDASNFATSTSKQVSVLIWLSQIMADGQPRADHKYENSATINKSCLWESKCTHVTWVKFTINLYVCM